LKKKNYNKKKSARAFMKEKKKHLALTLKKITNGLNFTISTKVALMPKQS